jgi:hypothetical protein
VIRPRSPAGCRSTWRNRALAVAAGAVAVSAALVWACAPKNPSTTGCDADAEITVNPAVGPPVAIVANTSVDGAPSTSGAPVVGVTITGSVTGAPCGVHGVSIAGAIAAQPTLPNYGAWAASIPLAQLQTFGVCPLPASEGGPVDAGETQEAGDDGYGVRVLAQAQIVGDPGTADFSITTSGCVSLVPPGLPPVGPTAAHECTTPAVDAGPAGVTCQIPRPPGPPAVVAVFGSSKALGLPLNWASARGLAVPAAASPTLVAAGDGGLAGSALPCPTDGDLCATESYATVIGAVTAVAGVDQITATPSGYASPVATITVSVQGPALVSTTSTVVAGYAPTIVTVSNPMGFTQTCTFGLSVGVEVTAIDETGGTSSLLSSCGLPTALDSGAGCIFSATSFTDATRLFSFSFDSAIDDAIAASNGLATPRAVTLVCVDSFGQVAATSLTAAWVGGATVEAGPSEGGAAD